MDKAAPPGAVFPKCFDTRRDYEQWYRFSSFYGIKIVPENAHCEDCTREYQWRMLLEGRCANPKASPEQ